MSHDDHNPFQESTVNDNQFYTHKQTSDDERLYGMLIYVTSIFTTLLAPLLIWLLKREHSTFIDHIGKDYLNFFISYSIWVGISTLLCLVLIGFILIPILSIMILIFTIIGAIKAFNGETYLPPLSIRFIK